MHWAKAAVLRIEVQISVWGLCGFKIFFHLHGQWLGRRWRLSLNGCETGRLASGSGWCPHSLLKSIRAKGACKNTHWAAVAVAKERRFTDLTFPQVLPITCSPESQTLGQMHLRPQEQTGGERNSEHYPGDVAFVILLGNNWLFEPRLIECFKLILIQALIISEWNRDFSWNNHTWHH